ncbi:hypothetical protein V3C99_009700 [Haemonchus contortus]
MASPNMSDAKIHLNPQVSLVIERLLFLYWLITVPFYTMLVVFMIHAQIKKAPNLTGSFYTLCITAGIVDIVTLLNNYFGGAFPGWGWMKSVYLTLGKPYVYFYIMTAWATGTMQVLSTSILATNRLWAILFPQQVHLWRGRRLMLTVVIQLLPGIVASLPILSYEVSLKESRNGGLIPLITNHQTKAIYFTVAAGFLTVNSVYLILAYSYLFFLIRKRNQIHQKTVSNSRIWQARKMDLWRKAGFRLFLMASWTVAAEVLYNLYIYSKIFIFPVFHISSEVFYTFYFVLK